MADNTFNHQDSTNSLEFDHENNVSKIADEKIRERVENFDKSGRGYIPVDDFVKKKRVRQYSIKSTLGQGSFSKVKLAIDTNTGEEAAIKIITRYDKNQNNSETYKKKEQRVFREALISLMAHHPHIVPLKRFYYNELYYLMVFERVRGSELLSVISKNGPLKEDVARKYFRQILSALNYLHSNSIVHRDLKIENILVDENDNIQIIDFGLSNFYDNKNNLKTFCGSLYFAAPELLYGIEYFGPEIDIWSLGVILYVMVVGRVPFDDPSVRKLHKKIKEAVVSYPEHLSPSLKKLLANIIDNNPENRHGIEDIMKDEWIKKGYSDEPIDSFIKKRSGKVSHRFQSIKMMSRILKPQYPNFTSEIKKFSDICKNTKNRERFFWDNLPSISLYYLYLRNFSIQDNYSKGKSSSNEENEKNALKYKRDECMYKLSKNLSQTRINEKFQLEDFPEKSSSATETDEENNKCCKRDKESCKHTQNAHRVLRKWIKKYLSKNSIGYKKHEKSFVCECNVNQVIFKITLYCNSVLKKHFLSLTRMDGDKEKFDKIVKNINSSLIDDMKGKSGIKCQWN